MKSFAQLVTTVKKESKIIKPIALVARGLKAPGMSLAKCVEEKNIDAFEDDL